MNKVIKLDKNSIKCKRHNKIFSINVALARAENMVTMNYFPKKKEFREHIIGIHTQKYPNSNFEVSNKDIKRLENPRKYEIPVNIVEIMEIVVEEVREKRESVNYRANDDLIISEHMLYCTLKALHILADWLDAHEEGERPENDKYRKEVEYVVSQLEYFDQKYNTNFNQLFT